MRKIFRLFLSYIYLFNFLVASDGAENDEPRAPRALLPPVMVTGAETPADIANNNEAKKVGIAATLVQSFMVRAAKPREKK